MSESRLERLEEFLRTNPDDAFVRYGLAMEYAKLGRSDEALAAYRHLLETKPDYLPAYYQAGALLIRLNRLAEARSTFERGIEVAARLQDCHTRSELEVALHELPPESAGDG